MEPNPIASLEPNCNDPLVASAQGRSGDENVSSENPEPNIVDENGSNATVDAEKAKDDSVEMELLVCSL